LLVGGDPGEVAVLREYFRLSGSYEVEAIHYCDDALEALSQQRFDLMLLLSIFVVGGRCRRGQHGFGGIELLKRMRALDIQVPVLVVSASTLAQAKREALASGAFGFIHKPLNLAELDEKKADTSG
jgi:CheY-like chemotaxis protein